MTNNNNGADCEKSVDDNTKDPSKCGKYAFTKAFAFFFPVFIVVAFLLIVIVKESVAEGVVGAFKGLSTILISATAALLGLSFASYVFMSNSLREKGEKDKKYQTLTEQFRYRCSWDMITIIIFCSISITLCAVTILISLDQGEFAELLVALSMSFSATSIFLMLIFGNNVVDAEENLSKLANEKLLIYMKCISKLNENEESNVVETINHINPNENDACKVDEKINDMIESICQNMYTVERIVLRLIKNEYNVSSNSASSDFVQKLFIKKVKGSSSYEENGEESIKKAKQLAIKYENLIMFRDCIEVHDLYPPKYPKKEKWLEEDKSDFILRLEIGISWLDNKKMCEKINDSTLLPNKAIEKEYSSVYSFILSTCLKDEDLTGNDMRGFDFSKDKLKMDRTLLCGCTLQSSKLDGAELSRASFKGCNLFKTSFKNADCRGANFSLSKIPNFIITPETRLEGAIFNECEMDNTEFINQNLSNTSFEHAKLVGSKIENTKMENANLGGETLLFDAYISGTDLSNSNLSKVNLVSSKIDDCNLSGVDLSGAKLTSSTIRRVIFEKSKITSANITNCRIVKCDFPETQSEDSSFKESTIRDTRFNRSNLNKANFSGAKIYNSDFSDALCTDSLFLQTSEIKEVKFTNALIIRTIFEGCTIAGCDFSGAAMNNSIFTNVKFIECTFDETDLRGSRFTDVIFIGSKELSSEFLKGSSFLGGSTIDTTRGNNFEFVGKKVKFGEAN